MSTISTTKLDPNKTWIPNSLIKSKAWLDLGGKAPHVFLIFLTKRSTTPPGTKKKASQKNFTAWNHKELEFTYTEASKLGIGEHAFRRAIDALVTVGFIDITRYGGGTEQRTTLYALSNRWKRYGDDDFKPMERVRHRRGFCSDEKRYKRKPVMDGN